MKIEMDLGAESQHFPEKKVWTWTWSEWGREGGGDIIFYAFAAALQLQILIFQPDLIWKPNIVDLIKSWKFYLDFYKI